MTFFQHKQVENSSQHIFNLTICLLLPLNCKDNLLAIVCLFCLIISVYDILS